MNFIDKYKHERIQQVPSPDTGLDGDESFQE